MHVVLGVLRQVVVEDHFDVVHVQSARRHVGRHEELETAFAKLRDHALAHLLRDVAVQFVGAVAARLEVIRQFVAHHFRPAKNDPVFDVLDVDQPAEHLQLRAAVDLVINLINRRHDHLLRLDAHVHRLPRVVFDQRADHRRHRGRKENRLPIGGRLLEDGLDVLAETHVEHPVGLVEDDHPEVLQLQRLALQMVHHAPWRADDDLRAFAQTAELAVVALPAVDRQLAHALLEHRQLRHLLRDLHGQLPRRAEDQHLRPANGYVHALDRRDGKCRGLARAGLRKPDDVGAGEELGNGLGLDRRRLLEAHFGDGLEDLRREPEFGEKFLLHPAL